MNEVFKPVTNNIGRYPVPIKTHHNQSTEALNYLAV